MAKKLDNMILINFESLKKIVKLAWNPITLTSEYNTKTHKSSELVRIEDSLFLSMKNVCEFGRGRDSWNED